MIEKYSFLLPLFIPIYYKLPLHFYISFCFFIFSNYLLTEKNQNKLCKIFQYECFVFLHSLYISKSIIASYLIVCLSLLLYDSSMGFFFKIGIFLTTFLIYYSRNPFLFLPFLYLLFLFPSIFIGVIPFSKKSKILYYNIIQTVFFFFCKNPISSKIIS